MDETQNIHDLENNIEQELVGIQSVYPDEGITDALVEIVTVPAFTLSPTTQVK
jgi:hypothetical protein